MALHVGGRGPGHMTRVSIGAPSASYAAGDGLTAASVNFNGASNISGNQDGSGMTVVSRAQSRVANPAALTNNGVSGDSNADTLAHYNGLSAGLKNDYQVVQIAGGNDVDTTPRARMANYRDFRGAFAAGGAPDHMLVTAFNYTSGRTSDPFLEKQVFVKLAMEAFPGDVHSLNYSTSDGDLYPQLNSADQQRAADGGVPSTYMWTDNAHMNGTGYGLQGDDWTFPIVRAFSGVLPFLAYGDYYSLAATANTAGGFVIDLPVKGDLTGCTVALEDAVDFAVSVQGTGYGTSTIRVTRGGAGGPIAAPFTLLRIRMTKGLVSAVARVRLGIGPLDDACYEVSFADGGVTSGLSGCYYRMLEPFAGVSNGSKFSFVIKWRPHAGVIGASYQPIYGTANGVNLLVNTNGSMSTFIRNGTGTTSVFTHATTGSSVFLSDPKYEMVVFGCYDTGASSGFVRYERRDATNNTVATQEFSTSAATMTYNAAQGPNLGIAKIHDFFVPGSGTKYPQPVTHGVLWMAADFFDFSQEANRALFRDAGSFALQDNYDAANNDQVQSVAGVGSGNWVKPYCSVRGNAAERYRQPNRGTGTAPTTDPADTGRMITNAWDVVMTTV